MVSTDMKNNTLSQTMSIYPNPSNGIFNLNLEASERPSSVKPSNVIITNITGEIINWAHKGTCPLEYPIQIDFSNHPKGIYFIQTETENGIYTQKFIIQ